MEQAMPAIADAAPVSKPALWTGRALSGLVILFLLFDGAIKLVPWPVVTETMDRMGYGPSETLARSLGFITIACTALYAVPPRRHPADRAISVARWRRMCGSAARCSAISCSDSIWD
jgi:DoxX-like family